MVQSPQVTKEDDMEAITFLKEQQRIKSRLAIAQEDKRNWLKLLESGKHIGANEAFLRTSADILDLYAELWELRAEYARTHPREFLQREE